MVNEPRHGVKRLHHKPREPMNYKPGRHDQEHLNQEDATVTGSGQDPVPPCSAPNKHSKPAQAWYDQAEALADWTMRRFVNRTDAWGQYFPLDQRSKGNARTRKGTLTKEILIRHYQGEEVSNLVGVHTTSADNTSSWLGIDIDLHGKPDKEKKLKNRQAAKQLYNKAKELGFDPLLISSNGQGGYHLVLFFKKPVPTPEVHAFGKWLLRDWQKLGLHEQPELFPKQPRLEEKKKYGNFLRLPGRHHTMDYFSKVWNGERWVSGEEAIAAILAIKGVSPKLIPEEVVAFEESTSQAAVDLCARIPASEVDQVQRRALALLGTMKAVQGKGGDKTTWKAALYLVKDFNLTVEQALPVFKKWNATHCEPPWSEEDLRRKLDLAAQEPGPRGRLVQETRYRILDAGQATAGEAGGSPFQIEVPDFILADWRKVQPFAHAKRKGRPSAKLAVFKAMILACVIRQRSSLVTIPDIVASQLLGGKESRWPQKGWRRALRRSLCRMFKLRKLPRFRTACPPACPLHGQKDVRHRHLTSRREPCNELGVLHAFQVTCEERDGQNVFTYDFRDRKSHHPDPKTAASLQKEIDEGKKKLWSIYLPAWLFGPAILKPGPCRILKSLTREVTRSLGKSKRLDKAQVIQGKTQPILDRTMRYVGFNGNVQRHTHGHGYKITSWMKRAGYNTEDTDLAAFWKETRRFLKDLQILHEHFGLVAGGYRSDKREWHPLDRLIDMTRSVEGQRWLSKCCLKVFGPEDYLALWRQYFAQAMGFSFIPGDTEEKVAETMQEKDAPVHITSALKLDTWMRQQGLTNRGLATMLGVPLSQVASQRCGGRTWSADFEKKLAAYLQSGDENA